MPSIDYTWDVSGGGSGSGAGIGTRRTAFSGVNDPLGSCLVRPFRRTERADFNFGSGIPEVLSCIGQVLGTRLGSLPWRPDFGCDLERLRHRTSDPTVSDVARVMVDDAIRKWEPRAQLTSVAVIDSPDNAIFLRITVRIGSKTLTIPLTV